MNGNPWWVAFAFAAALHLGVLLLPLTSPDRTRVPPSLNIAVELQAPLSRSTATRAVSGAVPVEEVEPEPERMPQMAEPAMPGPGPSPPVQPDPRPEPVARRGEQAMPRPPAAPEPPLKKPPPEQPPPEQPPPEEPPPAAAPVAPPRPELASRKTEPKAKPVTLAADVTPPGEAGDEKIVPSAAPASEQTPPSPARDGSPLPERRIYLQQLQQRIAQQRYYPRRSRARGEQGRVVVRFVLAADGSVKGLEVIDSSGIARLDQAAIKTVERAAPFDPLPAGRRQDEWTIEVPLVFKLGG